MLQVFELQQEFGGADFLSASRLFIKEGDLTKVCSSLLLDIGLHDAGNNGCRYLQASILGQRYLPC